MLLILEIYLGTVAWRNGWKAWALSPCALIGAFECLVGVNAGPWGATTIHVLPDAFAGDFLLVLALAVMSAVKPVPARSRVAKPAAGASRAQELSMMAPPIAMSTNH